MEFTEYLFLKAIALCIIAFVWQFIRGLRGLPVDRTSFDMMDQQAKEGQIAKE